MIDAGIVDANILLRYIANDQPAQVEAVERLLDKFASGEARGTLLPTVFLEIIYVLERQYDVSRQQISEALQDILTMDGFTIVDRAQLLDAAIDYQRRRGISFADAYHCAMARTHHNGVIVSFDRKLGGVPGV
jgi:predicted nucleic acid-binding protein